ncbi:MAG: hypothetical protein ACLUCU_05370 [Slackia sp.]
MKGKTQAAVGAAAALMLGLTGCGASFEGSGSKDAASAEQLAMRADDPWGGEGAGARSEKAYADGVYTERDGHGRPGHGHAFWMAIAFRALR